ncbi:MAG TPA: hypothetical protein PK613_09715 [Anaerolineaceae bacterium]|nr:hypothetical protein [Anaerolineaceae bacterium]
MGIFIAIQPPTNQEAANLPNNPTTAPIKIERRRILFIQVDHLPAPASRPVSPFQSTPQVEPTVVPTAPQLQTLSLALFSRQNPGITVVLLYPPQNGQKTDGASRLQSSFSLLPEGIISPAFADALKQQKISYDGYIIIDNEGIRQWIDLFNGLPIAGSVQNGNDILSQWNTNSASPEGVSAWHQLVAKGFCDRLPDLDQNAGWFKFYYTLFPDHLHTNISLEAFISDTQALNAFSSSITCNVSYP